MVKPSKRKAQSQAAGFQHANPEEAVEAKSSSSEEETYVHKESSSTISKENEGDESLNESTTDPLENLDLPAIADLFELCQSTCGKRNLSILIYSFMRHLRVSKRNSDRILTSIGAFHYRTSHKWTKAFLSADSDVFIEENRGGKHSKFLYDVFPEIELEARAFTVEGCSRKDASFTSAELAKFIDAKYDEVTGARKVNHDLIRSE